MLFSIRHSYPFIWIPARHSSVAGFRLPVLGPLSLSPLPLVTDWQRLLPDAGNGANILQVSSLSPPPQPKRRPRSWLLHFVATATPALWQLRHRFSPSSPSVVHTPLRSGSLLSSSPPITHARGTGKRRKNLSEPFPQTPSRHYKREREQVACAGVPAHPSPSSRCSLRSRSLCLPRLCNSTTQDGTSPPKISATLNRRQPPRRARPRFGSRLLTAYRLLLLGKQPPHPRGGHGSCRAASPHSSPPSPPTHPIKSRYA